MGLVEIEGFDASAPDTERSEALEKERCSASSSREFELSRRRGALFNLDLWFAKVSGDKLSIGTLHLRAWVGFSIEAACSGVLGLSVRRKALNSRIWLNKLDDDC